MNKSTAAIIISVLALAVAVGGIITAANAPVDLAAANDPARFPRGFVASRNLTGAQPVVVANAQSTGVPFQAQANGTAVASIDRSGNPDFADGGVSAADIVNPTRYVPLPLYSWTDCQTDAGAAIGFDTTADALPDYETSDTDGLGVFLRFDDTGSSEDQGSEACIQFVVPQVYASGGALVVRATKDAHTGATELLTCGASINGAALGSAATAEVTATASGLYTCTPAGTFSAGASVNLYLSITSSGTMNDIVDIAGAAFQYVATQ